MKEHLHTLYDIYYFETLKIIIGAFEKSGFSPIIVGGVAVQSHLLTLLGFERGKDRLRKTNDYDIVVPGIGEKKVIEIVHGLDGKEFETDDGIFSIKVLREGFKRPALKVEYLALDPEKIKSANIYLNISTKPEDLWYISAEKAERMYKDAVDIKIERSRTFSELRARVLAMEDLISTKLARGRKKDHKDVSSLVEIAKEKGIRLNWRRITENLSTIKDAERKTTAMDWVRAFSKR